MHVEGQIIEFAIADGDYIQCELVERDKAVDIIPHLLVTGMEYVWAVFMYCDTINILAIDIAPKVGALVYHKASLATPMGKIGKGGSKKTGTDYEIIIFLNHGELSMKFWPSCEIFRYPRKRMNNQTFWSWLSGNYSSTSAKKM